MGNKTKTLRLGLYRKLFLLMIVLSYVVAGVDGGGVVIVIAMAFSLAWIIFELWMILQGIMAIQSMLVIMHQQATTGFVVDDDKDILTIEGKKDE